MESISSAPFTSVHRTSFWGTKPLPFSARGTRGRQRELCLGGCSTDLWPWVLRRQVVEYQSAPQALVHFIIFIAQIRSQVTDPSTCIGKIYFHVTSVFATGVAPSQFRFLLRMENCKLVVQNLGDLRSLSSWNSKAHSFQRCQVVVNA